MNMNGQKVHFGQAKNGGYGLFTGNFLAWGLGDGEGVFRVVFKYGSMKKFAESLGFVFEGDEPKFK